MAIITLCKWSSARNHGMACSSTSITPGATRWESSQIFWTGTTNVYTIRNLRQGYGPTLFDLRNVIHGSGTYDLPFGRGKKFINQGGLVDRFVGGWTLGTILTIQSGLPFQLTGGYGTYNDYADGGLALNTASPHCKVPLAFTMLPARLNTQ